MSKIIKPIDLINIIGSPFVKRENLKLKDSDLLDIYDSSFENRIGLLMLEKYRYIGWSEELENKYQLLKKREEMTKDVISHLAENLNNFDKDNYIIFKSIKPYPATPNDTDVIYLGSKKRYKEMVSFLLNNGYEFHEWAPQQKTVYDVRGRNSIGKGKKGGTYYIDLYEEISTDYYAYLNRHVLRPFMVTSTINGTKVNLLKPEPEMAIILFHNVFPERTFQLEHFYLPLYYLKHESFDMDLFLKFVIDNKMKIAIQTNFTFIAFLHKEYFDFIPLPVTMILERLNKNNLELEKFKKSDLELPYMFSQKIFWTSFIRKSLEWYSFKSLLIQFLKMFNPIFFWDVVKALKNRLSKKGVYHAE